VILVTLHTTIAKSHTVIESKGDYSNSQGLFTKHLDSSLFSCLTIERGGAWLPAGYNPFGYSISKLGLKFLEFDGSLDSDVGRFLASLKSGRKNQARLQEQWLEIVRASKSGQALRIYRKMDQLIQFCLMAGLID